MRWGYGGDVMLPEYVEYVDYYDVDTAWFNDLPLWKRLAAQCGSPILELACGTGRLLIPLIEAGFRVDGLDLSETMLERCREKLEQRGLLKKTSITLQDMATFDLPQKNYHLIYVAFRSFMHLYSQAAQLACLKQVSKHLKPGGLFAVDIYAPDYSMLAQEPDQPWQYVRTIQLPNGNKLVRYDRHTLNDPKRQYQHSELKFEEHDRNDEVVRVVIVPIVTRYTFRYEMQLLLEKAGFVVEDMLRDFEGNDYDGTGEIIAIARWTG